MPRRDSSGRFVRSNPDALVNPLTTLDVFATIVGLVLTFIPEPATTATGLAILAGTFAANRLREDKG